MRIELTEGTVRRVFGAEKIIVTASAVEMMHNGMLTRVLALNPGRTLTIDAEGERRASDAPRGLAELHAAAERALRPAPSHNLMVSAAPRLHGGAVIILVAWLGAMALIVGALCALPALIEEVRFEAAYWTAEDFLQLGLQWAGIIICCRLFFVSGRLAGATQREREIRGRRLRLPE